MTKYWLGKTRDKKTRDKISKTLIKKGISPPSRKGISPTNKGKPRLDLRGSKNPRWNGGTWNYFKREVKIRDNYTCKICGLVDMEIMEIDHIMPKCDFPKLKNKIDNLMTICPNCHRRKTNKELRERNLGKSNLQRQKNV